MIIVRLQGGLGNQMFQYAAGLALATRWKVPLKLDLRLLLDRSPRVTQAARDFALPLLPSATCALATADECRPLAGPYPETLSSRLRRRLGGFPRWISQTAAPAPVPGLMEAQPPYYLDGYWQSEDYFRPIQAEIRRRYALPAPPPGATAELAAAIAAQPSVMVGIRRGDYVGNAAAASCNGFCGLDYYVRAIALIRRIQPSAPLFVFSDDIDWCREQLALAGPVTYVGQGPSSERLRDDLTLMTRCTHFVIPNSTLAWWAAWLGDRPDKVVICPRRWFSDAVCEAHSGDLVPGGWIRV